MKKNIVLYAPPAAGKGTECEHLHSKYGYDVISIGAVLRNQRTDKTEVGRKIIETQDKGILVPDDIVLEALKLEMAKYAGNPIVLEGYPRNIEQAKMLDTIMDNYIVINLYIDRELAKARALGRVTCSKCGKIYNMSFKDKMPKQEGICDECGAVLEDRSDDNEKSFNKRFDVYEENAPAIIDYYTEKGNLYRINSETSAKTSEEVDKILNEGN